MRVAILLYALLAPSVGAQTLLEHYQNGVAAAQEGRHAEYLSAMEAAIEMAPELPVIRRHRAQALAMLGRGDEAMAELRGLILWGVAFEPEEREEFASLREREDWPEFLADYARSREPTGSMELAFEIAVDDLIPEGIAYDRARDRFLLSSIAQRAIYSVAMDGTAELFLPSREHGYLAGLGLAVDGERGRLWAVSDAPDDSALFEPEEIGRSALHVFDLASGELLWSYVSEPDPAWGFNDLLLLPGGGAIVSAAGSGALLRFGEDGGEPSVLAEPGSVPGANGLCLSADASELYVSAYTQGILRVSLEGGAIRLASAQGSFTTAGVDGLYLHDGMLLAIQNYSGLDRVALFELGADGAIVGLEIAVARQEIFVDPTTGAIRDDRLYFIANSQVEPFLNRPDKESLSGFRRSSVYSIDLRR